jgi:hypothetical protein
MLLDLVLWSFTIVFVPPALGLAWQQTASIVQGLASILRSPSAIGPATVITLLSTVEVDCLHAGRGQAGAWNPGEKSPSGAPATFE